MNFIVVSLLFFQILLSGNFALDIDNYTNFIDELSQDEKFLDEYAKWSFKLFSQPDYIYGAPRDSFPCEIIKDTSIPKNVHELKPTDIKCIGAIGDSLTAGLGAQALTPIGLFSENRGLSCSIGGDHTYSKVLSLPNLFREYNSGVDGYSTKTSIIFLDGQNAKNNRLNVAKSGDRSNHMPDQARMLIERAKTQSICDWNNDWKVITLFVGGNDLCSFCEDPDVTKHTPEQYLSYVRDTLDVLYNTPVPRAFVNLVLVLDVRGVKDLNSGGFVCQTLHKRTCECAAFPTENQAKTLDDFIPKYHQVLIDLVDSGRYDGRDDFTVVVQPFMAQTKLPRTENNEIDFSYFAPDCFHFSGKGHANAALSLWNNMFEPVGAKQWFWHLGEDLKCPTNETPYLFTKKNSAKALENYKPPLKKSTTARPSPIETTKSEPGDETTKHHKHHKSHSKSQYSKMQIAVFAAFMLFIIVLFVIGISKRERVRVLVKGAGRRHLRGINNTQYDDDDDLEIWNRSKTAPALSNNNNLPKTHGTRMSFE